MVREIFPHYMCDHCKGEVVEKNAEDIVSWISISFGILDFSEERPLLITYMKKGYKDRYGDLYKKTVIHNNLHFCCTDCMVKFLLKHLGAVQESKKHNKSEEKTEPKPQTRFNDLDLVTDKDETTHQKQKKKV